MQALLIWWQEKEGRDLLPCLAPEPKANMLEGSGVCWPPWEPGTAQGMHAHSEGS